MDEHYCSLSYIENSTYTFCHTAIPIFSIVSSIAGWVITLFFFCNVVMWCITVLNSVITLQLQLPVICGSAVICVMGWWKNTCEKCLFFQHLLQTACVHRGSTTFETCDMDIPSFFLFFFSQMDSKVMVKCKLCSGQKQLLTGHQLFLNICEDKTLTQS